MRESKEAREDRQAHELWDFVALLRRAGNVVEEEVKFHPTRKWRLDLLITPNLRPGYYENLPIALEIEGRGRHVSFHGYAADMEKYNEVTIAGYRLLRVIREEIGNGDALELLAKAGVQVEPKAVDSPSITTHMRPDVPE